MAGRWTTLATLWTRGRRSDVWKKWWAWRDGVGGGDDGGDEGPGWRFQWADETTRHDTKADNTRERWYWTRGQEKRFCVVVEEARQRRLGKEKERNCKSMMRCDAMRCNELVQNAVTRVESSNAVMHADDVNGVGAAAGQDGKCDCCGPRSTPGLIPHSFGGGVPRSDF
ncbi:hypothetical protein CH063_13367 [Colletotrichum higginsianum]|uniref:Uncharacterized protein n=1 Tax=Colletotrichum higginsianum (strain IMI 349063) TaxID=759273 RepID=H1VU53_COLHI|nr:hypothetical protein CH063_13367 [Colletotrichum higginsianum]